MNNGPDVPIWFHMRTTQTVGMKMFFAERKSAFPASPNNIGLENAWHYPRPKVPLQLELEMRGECLFLSCPENGTVHASSFPAIRREGHMVCTQGALCCLPRHPALNGQEPGKLPLPRTCFPFLLFPAPFVCPWISPRLLDWHQRQLLLAPGQR